MTLIFIQILKTFAVFVIILTFKQVKAYLVICKIHIAESFVQKLCNLVLNFSRATEPPYLNNRIVWNFTAFIENHK